LKTRKPEWNFACESQKNVLFKQQRASHNKQYYGTRALKVVARVQKEF
jgi:hypothetical protein